MRMSQPPITILNVVAEIANRLSPAVILRPAGESRRQIRSGRGNDLLVEYRNQNRKRWHMDAYATGTIA